MFICLHLTSAITSADFMALFSGICGLFYAPPVKAALYKASVLIALVRRFTFICSLLSALSLADSVFAFHFAAGFLCFQCFAKISFLKSPSLFPEHPKDPISEPLPPPNLSINFCAPEYYCLCWLITPHSSLHFLACCEQRGSLGGA